VLSVLLKGQLQVPKLETPSCLEIQWWTASL